MICFDFFYKNFSNLNFKFFQNFRVFIHKYICCTQSSNFENLKIYRHDLKIDQFSDQS